MKLAISSLSTARYSETFISMQMERLPHVIALSGSPVANHTEPFGPIAPLKSLRGCLETAWSFGVAGKGWSGPQTAEVIRRLGKAEVNVVLANYGVSGASLLPACRRLGIPLVTHFHGYDAHQKNLLSRHAEEYQALAAEGAAFIAVSHGMISALVALGFPEQKIHLLRYGINPDRFVQKSAFPEVPLFFGVGRFTDKKAPYLTLMAFAKARERLPGARLVLAGTGGLLEVTHNLALVLGLGESVQFPGVISPEQVAAYLQQATAFVQHSIEPRFGPDAGDREGTPVAVLEAMMTGTPVIGTRHAGIGEVVENGKGGFLVEERDVDAMADAMVEIGSSSELALRLGQTARERAIESYSADQYINGLREILEKFAA